MIKVIKCETNAEFLAYVDKNATAEKAVVRLDCDIVSAANYVHHAPNCTLLIAPNGGIQNIAPWDEVEELHRSHMATAEAAKYKDPNLRARLHAAHRNKHRPEGRRPYHLAPGCTGESSSIRPLTLPAAAGGYGQRREAVRPPPLPPRAGLHGRIFIDSPAYPSSRYGWVRAKKEFSNWLARAAKPGGKPSRNRPNKTGQKGNLMQSYGKIMNDQIEVRNEAHWQQLRQKYGTYEDVAAALGVSRTSAYRYCRALPPVHIWYQGQRWTCYELRQARGLRAMQKRGNPRFHDGNWQSLQARKPRKGKIGP